MRSTLPSATHASCFLALLLCVLSTMSCDRKAADSTTPSAHTTGGGLVFDVEGERPYFHDFGSVVYGEQLAHTFRMRNAEGRPLVIRDMLASCGCTKPRAWYTDASGERVGSSRDRKQDVLTIPSGAVVELEIQIDTTLVQTKNQDKLAQVRVRTDSDMNPYLTLELHLIVVRAFRAVPMPLELGETPQSAGKSARTDISVEVRGNGSRIRAIDKVEGTFTADMQESQIAGETVWILTATAPPGLRLGPAAGSVTLTTTNPDGTGNGPVFTVPILAQVVPDIVVHPGTIAMTGESARGASFEADMLALVPGARVRVLATRIEGAGTETLRVEAIPSTPDDALRAMRHVLKLSAPAGFPAGPMQGRIVVEVDDPTVAQVVVPFSVNLR